MITCIIFKTNTVKKALCYRTNSIIGNEVWNFENAMKNLKVKFVFDRDRIRKNCTRRFDIIAN